MNDTMPSHVPILQELSEVKVTADHRERSHPTQESPIKIVSPHRSSAHDHAIPHRRTERERPIGASHDAPSYPHSKDSASVQKGQSLASLLIVRTLPTYASSFGESVSNYPSSLLTSSLNFNMQRFDEILAKTQQEFLNVDDSQNEAASRESMDERISYYKEARQVWVRRESDSHHLTEHESSAANSTGIQNGESSIISKLLMRMKLGASPKIEELPNDENTLSLVQSQQQLLRCFQTMRVTPYPGPFLEDLLEGTNFT